MLPPDQINALSDKARQIADPIIEFLIEDIARRVAGAGQLTSTASYQVWRLQQLGMSQREVKEEIRKRLKISLKDVEQLMKQTAEVGYRFDLERLPHASWRSGRDSCGYACAALSRHSARNTAQSEVLPQMTAQLPDTSAETDISSPI